MTLTITLDPETEQALERKAARMGLSASEYVQRLAEKSAKGRPRKSPSPLLPEIKDGKPRTGAELVAALKAAGVLNGYGDPNIDAQTLARQIRKQAETRDWS